MAVAIGFSAAGLVLSEDEGRSLLSLVTRHEFPALDARPRDELERLARETLSCGPIGLAWVPRTIYELVYLERYVYDRVRHPWDAPRGEGGDWALPPFYVQHQTPTGAALTEEELVRRAESWLAKGGGRPAAVHRRLNNAVLCRLLVATTDLGDSEREGKANGVVDSEEEADQDDDDAKLEVCKDDHVAPCREDIQDRLRGLDFPAFSRVARQLVGSLQAVERGRTGSTAQAFDRWEQGLPDEIAIEDVDACLASMREPGYMQLSLVMQALRLECGYGDAAIDDIKEEARDDRGSVTVWVSARAQALALVGLFGAAMLPE
eukprot:g231.t1